MDFRRWLAIAVGIAASACAGPGSLVPGQSGLPEVERMMGRPALDWRDAEGRHLVYPTGPMGVHTWMVLLDPADKVKRVENLLDEAHFAKIKPGMTKDEVVRTLGPPYPPWTMYFKARDELAWEWAYCDLWRARSRFDVLFDNTLGTVRSTLSIRETCGPDDSICVC